MPARKRINRVAGVVDKMAGANADLMPPLLSGAHASARIGHRRSAPQAHRYDHSPAHVPLVEPQRRTVNWRSALPSARLTL